MYNFNYQKATSRDDAISARSSADDGSYLAGGMTLIPTLKQRLAKPSDVIDLAAIDDLAGITDDGGAITIGAMTTHAAVANSDVVASKIPALAALAGHIGDPQVRNRGTIGGSIANNDPAADYPAGCVGLNATIITNKREISADDFFTDLFETVLEDGELITAVSFPVADKAAYAKFPNPASRYAIVGVMVAQTGGETRAAVTGASQSGVYRAADIEAALGDGLDAAAAKAVKVSADGLNSDIHASAEYRAHLISIMASRAATAAG
ncbi:MAG: xanthine dehydrogenase family protein subunit M [Alphaproteobacteria bacterium]|nr:xanthine dehydrogenase family protein subunit M [Alphaproteobacteria bacterium]MCZ6591231.1 xanthine dehydrogenase family protein subunit M [Alphaproteobacteria bacterium]MCZ6839065.1 xanthine dehydrogenase family protein subunit M [Alphaproteobacteria bacterium]